MRRMNSSSLLNLAFGALFALCFVVLVVFVSSFMRGEALAEAEAKARMMLDRNLAIHSYYSEFLKPRLLAWTAPFRDKDYFDPSWMSSSFAVREIQKRFEALSRNGYFMKDAAVNARNADNEADARERDFLDRANADPGLVTESYTEKTAGVTSLVYLRRGEVLEAGCLGCHSSPDKAPAELVRIYGPLRGFGREAEVGKVISAISIRVPLAKALDRVTTVSIRLLAILMAVLVAFLFLVSRFNRRLFLDPIDLLRDKALAISSDEGRLGEQVTLPAARELGDLAGAFNRMSLALRDDRDKLEERIRERSADLAEANKALQADIADRKRFEELLQKSLEENKRLLGELQHRAKNSFNLINSLVGLAATEAISEETRGFLDGFERRIASISELYSLLYSTGAVEDVGLDEYGTRILSGLSSLSTKKLVKLTGDFAPLVVNAKIAAPFGIILTELVTNSLKHAFTDRQEGRIEVRLGMEEGRARLEVRDDGVGSASGDRAAARPAMGLSLVEGLSGQLGGTFRLESDEAGTRAVLLFPPR